MLKDSESDEDLEGLKEGVTKMWGEEKKECEE